MVVDGPGLDTGVAARLERPGRAWNAVVVMASDPITTAWDRTERKRRDLVPLYRRDHPAIEELAAGALEVCGRLVEQVGELLRRRLSTGGDVLSA